MNELRAQHFEQMCECPSQAPFDAVDITHVFFRTPVRPAGRRFTDGRSATRGVAMSTMTFSGPVTARPVPARPVPARLSRLDAELVSTGRVDTEQVGLSNGTVAQPSRPLRPAPPRPGRRSGRTGGPVGRPGSGVRAPELRRSAGVVAAACAADVHPSAQPRRVHSRVSLTDRGIAVILVAGVMVAVAALTVISATASHVTSDHYLLASLSAR